jgi:2'-5' RNA ligase superfamily
VSEAAGQGAPLILTALLPRDMQAWATALRTRHFPPERNYLEAHVTLFHALPAQCETEVAALLKRLAGEFAPVEAQLLGLMSLGRGTALKLESPGLLRLRDGVADHLRGLLTAQDQHRPRLHVTIQNKVAPTEAKALQRALEGTIEKRRFAFRGLGLYRYLGGPWQHIRDFAFRGQEKVQIAG